MPRIVWTTKRLLSRPDRLDNNTRGLVQLSEHEQMNGRGIYDISIQDGTIPYPKRGGRVIYIGKATSDTTILSRLKDHRSRTRGNPNLYSFFKHEKLKIRYCHLHAADVNLINRERNRLQDHFDQHGNVPIANRQSPVSVSAED